MAIGGGTNAVVHLLALAGRVGVPLTLDRFDELSRRTPLLANVRPSGEHLVEQLHRAGGVARGAARARSAAARRRDRPSTGGSLADGFAAADALDRDVIAPLDAPLAAEGGIAVVRGSLAPDGATRSSGAPPTPRCFATAGLRSSSRTSTTSPHASTIRRSRSARTRCSCSGTPARRAAPGCRSGAQLPIPKKLLAQGVTDMVRISDARMSGTAFGTVVLHVAPEAAAGGPLRAVRDGDPIVLDVAAQRLDLDIPAAELAARLERLGAAAAEVPPRLRRALPRARAAGRRGLRLRLPARGRERPSRSRSACSSGWIGGW